MSKLALLISIYLFSFINLIIITEGPLQYPEPPEGWNNGDCQSLQNQSPIDIPSVKDISLILDNGSHAKIKNLGYSIINSGEVKFDHKHKWTTQELNVGYIEIELNRTLYKYKLHSIHFHLYSEHRLENHQYPMEMHMVHKNMNKNDKQNENLVIGVLFDYNSETDNEFLKNMNLSNEKKINGANILSLINKTEEFYYYKGGLTTIPCTENVNWIVYRDIKHMSFNQFDKFRKWIENSNMKYYGVGYGNARGPKRLNGRKIYLENRIKEGSSFVKYLLILMFIIALIVFYFFYFHKISKKKVD